MDLVLRTFKVPDEFLLRISNRAFGQNQSSGDLVRSFLESFLKADLFSIKNEEESLVLRSFYLSKEQDKTLDNLASKFQTTKGAVFRAAMAHGLGVTKPEKYYELNK